MPQQDNQRNDTGTSNLSRPPGWASPTPPPERKEPLRMSEKSVGQEAPIASINVLADVLRDAAPIDDESIQELADSIFTHGLLSPLTVAAAPPNIIQRGNMPPTREPRFELLAGRRRLYAIQLLVRQQKLHPQYRVPVRVIDGSAAAAAAAPLTQEESDVRRLVISLMENGLREDLPRGAVAKAIAQMADKGMPQIKIAQMLCKSEAWVSKQVAIARSCCEDVKEALNLGKISINTAYGLSQKTHNDQKKDLHKLETVTEKVEAPDTLDDVERVNRERKAEEAERSDAPPKRASEKILQAILLKAKEQPDCFYTRGVYAGIQLALGYLSQLDMQEAMERMTTRERAGLPTDPTKDEPGMVHPDAMPDAPHDADDADDGE